MEERRWEKESLEERDIEELLRKAGEQEEIPESLRPEHMKNYLQEQEGKKPANKKRGNFRKWYGIAGAAACLVLVLFVGGATWSLKNSTEEREQDRQEEKSVAESAGQPETAEETVTVAQQYDTTYEDLYQFFREQENVREESFKYSTLEKLENSADESTGSAEWSTDGSSQQSAEANQDYAATNRQEEGVEEADLIKNDGRYLYQVITDQDHSQKVQITDTNGGLKEAARIGDFGTVGELYVWEDTLVVFEYCWAEKAPAEEETTGEETVTAGENQESFSAAADMAWSGTPFQKIHVYDITDREDPKEEHVFTLEGNYLDSRLVNGYLYCFLTCGVELPENGTQYEDYVPVLEGKAMEASSIYLPQEAQDSAYVVIASVDLRNPTELKDARAMVSSADRVYVTEDQIYVTESISEMESFYEQKEEGIYHNKTNIVRFSYQNGMIRKEAEGSVKGILLDDMAINEYDGFLRLAVTVESGKSQWVVDDLSGEAIGYERTEHRQDNSLYVLDENLSVVGKIEGLAEEEQIYSARFMKDTGYFVTFRQVDPLFSVDLSDPENPRILGELKISGFSEYLHFYSQDLLLGIGMEADEETGATDGIKLSMFDISDPSDVKEQDKYSLSEYSYSEGLYDYKAVLIDTEKNLFGFFAEGWGEEEKADYLLFSYENGAFQQKLKIACERDTGSGYARVRGTYIGDVFYLMYGDGRIEAYSLTDGSLLEKISRDADH